MRGFQIWIALYLLFSQCAQAADEPWEALRKAQGSPRVIHETVKGKIVCRDPQLNFDPELCLAELKLEHTGESLPEHMLVDMILGKRLLGKEEAFIERFLPKKTSFGGTTNYMLNAGYNRMPSTAPLCVLSVTYDNNHKVVRYRSRFYEDGSTNVSVDSDWIQ